MPHDNKTEICPQSKVSCYSRAEINLLSNELFDDLETGKIGKNRKSICNCLPSCTSINYDLEIAQANYEFAKLMESIGENMTEYQDSSMARLVIFFKDSQFITSHRSELFGLTDFLASCGGLLGKIKN